MRLYLRTRSRILSLAWHAIPTMPVTPATPTAGHETRAQAEPGANERSGRAVSTAEGRGCKRASTCARARVDRSAAGFTRLGGSVLVDHGLWAVKLYGGRSWAVRRGRSAWCVQ